MDHSQLMVDIPNVHVSWLMYRSHLPHGTEDDQNTKNKQSTDNNYLSAIGINFPTRSPTT